MCIYCSITELEMALQFKEQRQKKLRRDFYDCHITLHMAPNGYTSSQIEMIIYCCYTTIQLPILHPLLKSVKFIPTWR